MITSYLNTLRKRVPFVYWLLYDAIIGPILIADTILISYWFSIALAVFTVALVFDVNEAIIKWVRRT